MANGQKVSGMVDAMAQMVLQWTAAMEPAAIAMHNSLYGYEVQASPLCARGQVIAKRGVVFMHQADAIRLKHPKGLAGSFAAAEEYIAWTIDQNVAAALARIEGHPHG